MSSEIPDNNFHDATISYVHSSLEKIYFKGGYIDFDDCRWAIEFFVENVTEILRNDKVIRELTMEGDEANILELQVSDGRVELFVDWEENGVRQYDSVLYIMPGAKIRVGDMVRCS